MALIQTLTALFSGIIFGLGLILSGMSSPLKVQAFLDLAGAWDPSLALVMVGAIAVAMPAFYWVQRRQQTLLSEPLHLPGIHHLDWRLLSGSAIFGIGWGLAGFCPGPALVSLSAGNHSAMVFSIAMLSGMLLYELVQIILARRQKGSA